MIDRKNSPYAIRMRQEAVKRAADIIDRHAKGETYREIGESMDPPITKQRVLQIILKFKPFVEAQNGR